ncbi:MAG: hypothetical protein A2107_13570 [Verrucomicrobia bacterium GWF2_62_7]|nr:MAG: hypothetical protein A2107_13570 [Verrucomicrobia bacterium GWF2_62_7]
MDFGDHVGPRKHKTLVPAFAAFEEIVLAQFPRLDASAHRAVEDDDAAADGIEVLALHKARQRSKPLPAFQPT